ncbi:flagellar hook-basal body protein FliE [Poriferisphaera corsica]|uniref:Flagellar hook-basal body complex protein FliE n=1 Tax=Poriferisphaera corsica TaxID=2528020 RepID=A0A517YSG4_9BACT|nr:flagellar hook-basal body complex protein FliE [Poriferisphaera corsica]QDU33164.1 flagellar hook-basal body protein FliE [Poriferisphaera corsica]
MSDPLGLINSTQNLGGIQPGKIAKPAGPEVPGAPEGPSFKDVLMKNIEQVNRMQQDAEMAIEDLASGKRDDMDAVLMAKQKADIAFQTLLQVRNKLMTAFEEVKQIRV